ncbi:MAG: rod-binding protein [Pirellulales bacterium]|nr:rod-binding protein [Pirellulales bacterium]
MNVNLASLATTDALQGPLQPAKPAPPGNENDAELRDTFNSFVGESLFGQLLKAMRKTVGKSAYFHGGQAEEVFQQQLDQVLAEKLTEVSGEKFSEPMFALFQQTRI